MVLLHLALAVGKCVVHGSGVFICMVLVVSPLLDIKLWSVFMHVSMQTVLLYSLIRNLNYCLPYTITHTHTQKNMYSSCNWLTGHAYILTRKVGLRNKQCPVIGLKCSSEWGDGAKSSNSALQELNSVSTTAILSVSIWKLLSADSLYSLHSVIYVNNTVVIPVIWRWL